MLYFALCGFALAALTVAAPFGHQRIDGTQTFDSAEIQQLLARLQSGDQRFLDNVGERKDSRWNVTPREKHVDESEEIKPEIILFLGQEFEDANTIGEDKYKAVTENLDELDIQQEMLDLIQIFTELNHFRDELGIAENVSAQSEPEIADGTENQQSSLWESIDILLPIDREWIPQQVEDPSQENIEQDGIDMLGLLDEEIPDQRLEDVRDQDSIDKDTDIEQVGQQEDVLEMSFVDSDQDYILGLLDEEISDQRLEDVSDQDGVDKDVNIEQVSQKEDDYEYDGDTDFKNQPEVDYYVHNESIVDVSEQNNSEHQSSPTGQKDNLDMELLIVLKIMESDDKTHRDQMPVEQFIEIQDDGTRQNTKHVSFDYDKSEDTSSQSIIEQKAAVKQQGSELKFQDNDKEIELEENLNLNTINMLHLVEQRQNLHDNNEGSPLDLGLQSKLLTNLKNQQDLENQQLEQNKAKKTQSLENEVTEPRLVDEPSKLSEDAPTESPVFWSRHWGRAKDQVNALAQKIHRTFG